MRRPSYKRVWYHHFKSVTDALVQKESPEVVGEVLLNILDEAQAFRCQRISNSARKSFADALEDSLREARYAAHTEKA